jgi:hypothetical protein
LDWTTTMCGVSPEICEPDLEIEFDTITPNAASGPAGGGALLPESVVQPVPQFGVFRIQCEALEGP